MIFLTNQHVKEVLDMPACLEAMEDAYRELNAQRAAIDNPKVGTIPEIIAGRWKGRTSDSEITFLNNQGTQGLQFAAVGGTAYRLAKEKGLGHPLSLEWFVQNIRD